MGEKRAADDEGDKPVKRHRYNASLQPSKRQSSAVDQTSGQRYAFGNLNSATVPSDEELEWEDDTDALAYLRSVREEAGGIPHVLVAKKAGPELPTPENDDGDRPIDRSIYQDGRGDYRGYYHDGTYIARPEGYEEEYEEDDEDEDTSIGGPRNSNSAEIHEAYYTALTNQYYALRNTLQSEPPERAVAALPKDNPTEVGNFGASKRTFKEWSDRIRNTNPIPAQIACMNKDSIIRLLRIILGGKFFRKGQELRERTSRWIWALLARLPERGELDYIEVGRVRELGQRAVFFMLSLAEADVLREQYGVGGGGGGGSEDGAEVDVEEGIDEELSLHDSDENERPQGNRNAAFDANVDHKKAATQLEKSQTGSSVATPGSDVDMEIDSNREDGEVSDDPQTQTESSADIERAKAQLLARLDGPNKGQADTLEDATEALPSPKSSADGKSSAEEENEATRALINVRATLNMIITVAGEFYGQRDLLEFRNPFGNILQEYD
ncbi:hypothetical protein BJ170DRAFT_585106 [Xylariales sp. AK1849]|nr:hypothetical protein BJ170DRAFT_585106 [Xylariales sp. AK1849]